jgi:hypothetical protein
MALVCNIDRKGRLVRLVYGVILIVTGLVLMIGWAWPAATALSWIVSVCAILGGSFAVFEARTGWCAVRALGFRTPM